MIKFGTSGFRGIIADNFTKENVQKVAYGFVKYLEQNELDNIEISVGYDNRFLSKDFAKWFSEVVCAYGVKVNFYTCSVPSSLICYNCKKYDFGVMITSSHNPYYYNGIKLFIDGGKDCDENTCSVIEKFANIVEYEDICSLSYDDAIKSELLFETENIRDYCNSLLNLVDVDLIRESKLKVLINTMNGSSYDCMQKIFNELEIDYCFINNELDPYFRNILPAPYIQNLKEETKIVLKNNFDICFCLDGDGDRFACIDKSGKYLDCNYILPIMYKYYLEVKGYKGDLVKNNAMSNLSKLLCKYLGTKCYEASVGFKNIGKILSTTDAFIGGESNGIAFKDNICSKDGIFVSLLLTEIMAFYNKSIGELVTDLQKLLYFPQEVYEYAYPITKEKKDELYKLIYEDKKLFKLDNRKIEEISYKDGLKITYEKDYWCCVRFSGTENVIRIFVEFENKEKCDEATKTVEKFLNVHDRQQ